MAPGSSTNQPVHEAWLRLQFQSLNGSERPPLRPMRPGGVVPRAGPQAHVVPLPSCDPRSGLGLQLLFFHSSIASSGPDWTWLLPLWQLQGERSAGLSRFSSAVTRRRGASMATGPGKPRAASPEATVHSSQVGGYGLTLWVEDRDRRALHVHIVMGCWAPRSFWPVKKRSLRELRRQEEGVGIVSVRSPHSTIRHLGLCCHVISPSFLLGPVWRQLFFITFP